DAGFDYIELPVGTLMSATDEAAYRRIMDEIRTMGVPVEACNVFIPATLKITGPDVAREPLWQYADTALQRMGEIGVRVCVFGSGGARSIPDGFDRAQALDQLAVFLDHVQEASARHGVRVVIEPLNRGESNVFNSVAESDEFNQSRGLAGIGVLADLYHLSVEGETYDGMVAAGERLGHVHVADADRSAPGEGAPTDYAGFFQTLRQIGYAGMISIEARWRTTIRDELRGTEAMDRETEHHRVLAFARRQWDTT
ncbi:MAG TPA: sugar phosphate isomerase/epimerase family protein, partial [Thermomicrobiales bacterium]